MYAICFCIALSNMVTFDCYDRSQKIAGTAQALLGGDEVYHYSTKVSKVQSLQYVHYTKKFILKHFGAMYFFVISCCYWFKPLKLMMKEPRTGGSFVWHQDYGYFYQNGCIFPEMAAIFMPIDRCEYILILLFWYIKSIFLLQCPRFLISCKIFYIL